MRRAHFNARRGARGGRRMAHRDAPYTSALALLVAALTLAYAGWAIAETNSLDRAAKMNDASQTFVSSALRPDVVDPIFVFGVDIGDDDCWQYQSESIDALKRGLVSLGFTTTDDADSAQFTLRIHLNAFRGSDGLCGGSAILTLGKFVDFVDGRAFLTVAETGETFLGASHADTAILTRMKELLDGIHAAMESRT